MQTFPNVTEQFEHNVNFTIAYTQIHLEIILGEGVENSFYCFLSLPDIVYHTNPGVKIFCPTSETLLPILLNSSQLEEICLMLISSKKLDFFLG